MQGVQQAREGCYALCDVDCPNYLSCFAFGLRHFALANAWYRTGPFGILWEGMAELFFRPVPGLARFRLRQNLATDGVSFYTVRSAPRVQVVASDPSTVSPYAACRLRSRMPPEPYSPPRRGLFLYLLDHFDAVVLSRWDAHKSSNYPADCDDSEPVEREAKRTIASCAKGMIPSLFVRFINEPSALCEREIYWPPLFA